MATDYNRLLELAQELESYAVLEGSEIGELCSLLCTMVPYTPYMGKTFNAALVKELKSQLKSFKDHSTIVDDIEKFERPVKRLEWND